LEPAYQRTARMATATDSLLSISEYVFQENINNLLYKLPRLCRHDTPIIPCLDNHNLTPPFDILYIEYQIVALDY
jgi:hypothetical protein